MEIYTIRLLRNLPKVSRQTVPPALKAAIQEDSFAEQSREDLGVRTVIAACQRLQPRLIQVQIVQDLVDDMRLANGLHEKVHPRRTTFRLPSSGRLIRDVLVVDHGRQIHALGARNR